MLSDLLYILANYLSIPGLLRTSSFLTLSIRDTPTKLLKHFISRTFTSFSQHFSYPMPMLRTTPLVQLLLRIDTSWSLSPILYCSGHSGQDVRLPSHGAWAPSDVMVICSHSPSHSMITCSCAPSHGMVTCSRAPSHGMVTCSCAPSHRMVTCSCAPSHSMVTCSCAPSHRMVTCSCAPSHRMVTCSCAPSHRMVTSSCAPSHGMVTCNFLIHHAMQPYGQGLGRLIRSAARMLSPSSFKLAVRTKKVTNCQVLIV